MTQKIVELLNAWGAQFFAYAGSLLWQSSILILLLFAIDFAFHKKISPAVRYAFWMVILIKLLLPPSFALPTSPAWWWHPAAKEGPQPQVRFVATYAPSNPQPTIPSAISYKSREPSLTLRAFIFAAAASGTLVLFVLVLVRHHRLRAQAIRRDAEIVCSSTPDSRRALESAASLLVSMSRDAGFRRPIRLLLTSKQMSPAVYGLFRPVILLPAALLHELSPLQLRAIFLHELIHLRRGDLLINCAQTILQIVYWWHPLFWLANARIRTLREQAVDEAVMAALGTEAESYPALLLRVAKCMLQRMPLLGLIGILETKRALRRRIERLAAFETLTRNTKISFVTVLAIFAFGAVAIPMGQAPEVKVSPNTSLHPVQLAELSPHETLDVSNHEPGPLKTETLTFPPLRYSPTHTNLLKADNFSFRVIRLNRDTFYERVCELAGLGSNASYQEKFATFLTLLEKSDIHLKPPESIFETKGKLLIYASSNHLDLIEHFLSSSLRLTDKDQPPLPAQIQSPPPQIYIQAYLAELSPQTMRDLKRQLASVPGSSNSDRFGEGPNWSSVLTPAQMDYALTFLPKEKQKDLPNRMAVTTANNRGCQLQLTTRQHVTMLKKQGPNEGTLTITHSTVTCGPTVDFTPRIDDDGLSVGLKVSASNMEYLGYDHSTGWETYDGQKWVKERQSLPHFHLHTISTGSSTLQVKDGQTLVMGNAEVSDIMNDPDGIVRTNIVKAEKQFVLFLSPTLIDSAGNPVHSR